jgi:hypothetical protein
MHYHLKQVEDSFPNLKVMPLTSRNFYTKGEAHPTDPNNNIYDHGDHSLRGESLDDEPMEDGNLPPDLATDDPILHDEAFEALLECYGPSLKVSHLGVDGKGIHP